MVYKNFSKFVLRAPLFSFSYYKSLTQNAQIQESDLSEICKDEVFKEAIFLASPVLYGEMEKWLNGELTDIIKCEKLRHSLLKYLSRMCSRCTPFGLFAGTSVGMFSDATEIELSDKSKNNRHTRLDMNYLVALSQDLVKDREVRNQLLFYPNSSAYEAGHQLRYIEYSYVDSKRIHQIVAVDNSDYLMRIFQKAKKGASPMDMANEIVDDEVTLEDATNYVEQLIESQLLISELEPSVSGPEFLDQILLILRKLNGTENVVAVLEEVQKKLSTLDKNLGNRIDDYIGISKCLESIKTGFELKFLFQTDMQLTPEANRISQEVLKNIGKAISFFNRLSTKSNAGTSMSAFQSSFYERYGDREIPLSKALDVELGIGFIQGQDSGDLSPLLEGLEFPESETAPLDLTWSRTASVIRNKLTTCLQRGDMTIKLEDKDFDQTEENWTDLPDTMSSIVELVTVDGEEKVIISGMGGTNGAKLLGRFCHGDPELLKFTKEIIDVEDKINDGKILAEVVHLPEARVGNILIRPDFRKYEIPYLARSILKSQQQIELEDLMISTRPGQRVRLRSKKMNKEVIPCLTVAHNYSNVGLPIYQFLASLRSQQMRSGIGFSWPLTFDEYDFLPRVEYQGVIIAQAIWNISTKDIESYLTVDADLEKYLDRLSQFFSSRKIPQYVVLVDGDNELLVNTKNISSIQMLFDTVRKRKRFQMKEFLHLEDGPVKGGNDIYSNQIIVSFYNDEKLNKPQSDHG